MRKNNELRIVKGLRYFLSVKIVITALRNDCSSNLHLHTLYVPMLKYQYGES